MIDPPEGWRYGFPKPAPEFDVDLREWLIEQGYPKSKVDFALKHMRYFGTQEEIEELSDWEKEYNPRASEFIP